MASRRRFIASAVAAWLPGSRVARRGPRAASAQDADELPRGTLDAVVDAIVPRDSTPGALDVGVPKRILRELSDEPAGRQLYRDGLAMLEALARESSGSSFRSLDVANRERILVSLDSAAPDGLGRRFVRRVRRDVLSLYWASAEAQKIVGYRAPVSGYPEYTDPPVTARPRTR